MISIEDSDMYRFVLRSDDGSRLWVDGELVVDNDGLHASLEKTGAIALAKGWHQIAVEWFNKTGGADLSVKMGALGSEPKPIPDGMLRH